MDDSPFSVHSPRVMATRRAITAAVAHESSSRDLLDEVDSHLRRVVPSDSGGWWTSDPETLLPSELWSFDYASIEREVSEEATTRLESLEATKRTTATTDNSRTVRAESEAHLPPGVTSDLRVLARSGGSAWGSACLARGSDLPPFSTAEVEFVASIAGEVGKGLRMNLLRTATDASHSPSAPLRSGTVVLVGDDVVEGYTPEAKQWLESLGVRDISAPLPTALRWIALQARILGTGGKQLRPARSHLTSTNGQLIAVQAELLHGPEAPKVLMTLEAAHSKSLFSLLLALHGLTVREKSIAGLIVGGWQLEDIAAQLEVSLYTVRDHVKAIYAKVGVRSRPELTARLGGSESYSAAVA